MVKIFFLTVVIFFFTVYFHNIIELDQDLGRHLLMGKIISQTHNVPKVNLLSYTYPDFPFINTHWFSEVIFYQINNLIFLLWFKIFILILAMTLTIYTAYRFSQNLLTTALAFIIFAPVLLERTEIRPEIFSYLFTAIFLYFIYLNKFPKFLYILFPLLELIWVNSHIYFFLGPAFLVIWFLKNKKVWPLFLLTLLITIFNPNGLTGALYPLLVFKNYGYTIVENQNIFYLSKMIYNPNIFYFEIATTIFLLSFFVTKFKIFSFFVLAMLVLIFLPVQAIRSFPFLFLIQLPIFAKNLTFLNFPKFLFWGVIGLTIFGSMRLMTDEYYKTINSHKRFNMEVAESGKGAVDFVIKNNLSGPIFNNFDIGSYLDYRFYPKEKVFVDGRPEAYPASFFEKIYKPMQIFPEDFSAVDKIYHFNLIIFAHTDATQWGQIFLAEISKNPNWKKVYIDNYAVVFIRS